MTHVSVRMSSSLSDIGELEAVKSEIAEAKADLADAKVKGNDQLIINYSGIILELQKKENRLADEGIIFYQ